MFNYLNKRRKKGQSTLEYAVLVIIVIGCLLAIQVYIKRGVSGRLKQAADDIGDQYSVGNTNVVKIMTTSSLTANNFAAGEQSSKALKNEVTTELMNSEIINQTFEFWQ